MHMKQRLEPLVWNIQSQAIVSTQVHSVWHKIMSNQYMDEESEA